MVPNDLLFGEDSSHSMSRSQDVMDLIIYQLSDPDLSIPLFLSSAMENIVAL